MTTKEKVKGMTMADLIINFRSQMSEIETNYVATITHLQNELEFSKLLNDEQMKRIRELINKLSYAEAAYKKLSGRTIIYNT